MWERQHLAGSLFTSKMLAFRNKNNADFFLPLARGEVSTPLANGALKSVGVIIFSANVDD